VAWSRGESWVRWGTVLLLGSVLVATGCSDYRCSRRFGQSRATKWDLVEDVENPYPGARGRARGKVFYVRPRCSLDWHVGKKKLQVRLKDLPPNLELELVSTPAFEEQVVIRTNKRGRAKWRGPVPAVGGLAQGFQVEVRTRNDTTMDPPLPDGLVVLGGPLATVNRTALTQRIVDEDPRLDVTVDAKIEGWVKPDRERARIAFDGFSPGTRVRLLLEDRESGGKPVLAPVGERVVGRPGTASFTFDSGGGSGLPFGVRRLRDLWGRPIYLEVDGREYAYGLVPRVGLEGDPPGNSAGR